MQGMHILDPIVNMFVSTYQFKVIEVKPKKHKHLSKTFIPTMMLRKFNLLSKVQEVAQLNHLTKAPNSKVVFLVVVVFFCFLFFWFPCTYNFTYLNIWLILSTAPR